MAQVPRAERVRKRFEAAFGAAGESLQTGQTFDVSEQGVALLGRSSYPAGTQLRIVIRPADHLPLELRGRVVWSGTRGMGVQLAGPQRRYLELVATSIAAEADRNRRSPSSPAVPRVDLERLRQLAVRRQREGTLPPEPASGRSPSSPPPLIPAPPAALLKPSPAISASPDESEERTPVDPQLPARRAARAPRFEELLPVRLGTHPAQLDVRGFLVNVSGNGISVQCAAQWVRGTRVAVAIVLSEGHSRVDGLVAWSKPGNVAGTSLMGIRLLGTTPTYLELVAHARQRG